MILVKRSMPARTPADSAPTSFLTGSDGSGPVMISPRELVLTAPLKKRKGKGDSGSEGARTCGTKDTEDRLFTGPAASPLTAHVPAPTMATEARRRAHRSGRGERCVSFMTVSFRRP